MMQDSGGRRQSDADDAEFDGWLHATNQDITASLAAAIDTEASLRRLKQDVARETGGPVPT